MRYRTSDRFPNAECRQAKIKGGRLHDLRHTASSKMIEAGADLVTVTKILAMRLSK
jgi:integrase